MDYELIFSSVGILSFIGWGALIAAPINARLMILGARAVGILLAIAYVLLVGAGWGVEPEVSYGSLAGVMEGMAAPVHMMSGWTHFLAFDLLIGSWMVERARASEINHLLVIPCLAVTFLFGPAGFLLFLALEAVHKGRTASAS
jgi:ABA4-like protein